MQGIRFDGGIQSFTNLAVSADSSLGRLLDKPEFVLLSCLLALHHDPVKYRGNLYVRIYACPYICLSVLRETWPDSEA